MKNILIILILALLSVLHSSAQQKGKTNYMIITINSDDYKLNMIATRTDSAQVQQHLELHSPNIKAKDQFAAGENLILLKLKTYFDKGWKLVSTSVEKTSHSENSIYRYFLSKGE